MLSDRYRQLCVLFDDRYVMISVQNMDEFFEAVGSQEFFCRTNWREEKLWHCQEGMPQYEMKLLRKADGLKVQMYADPIFYGRKYLYFLSEKIQFTESQGKR